MDRELRAWRSDPHRRDAERETARAVAGEGEVCGSGLSNIRFQVPLPGFSISGEHGLYGATNTVIYFYDRKSTRK